MKIDCYTTSYSFTPSKNCEYYHHKRLDPNDESGWKKNTILFVRATNSGIDYHIKFITDGRVIPKSHPRYSDVKRWKYYAQYKIIKEYAPNESKTRKIPVDLRDKIVKKQQYRCNLCGEKFDAGNRPDIDHIIEMSLGGLTEENNLQALCKIGCHELKTYAFKKAKQKGLVNPDNWKIKKEDYLVTIMKKLFKGPLYKKYC